MNFEGWYQNGFWGENYNPYSIVIDGKVVANVSVNKTDMLLDGEIKHFLQLGTVMTDDAYRNQGLSRRIMEEIEADYAGKVDGIYLFGNDSVLEFYPRFGFKKSEEYLYKKMVCLTGEVQLEQVVMDNAHAWQQLVNAMERSVFRGKMDMVHNIGLIMFYVSSFMQESVYYHQTSDTYVIAEREEDRLFIHNVFSSTLTKLDDVIALFGNEMKEVTLGFTPIDKEEYIIESYHEEDCTFFAKGDIVRVMKEDKLRIPSLSHA